MKYIFPLGIYRYIPITLLLEATFKNCPFIPRLLDRDKPIGRISIIGLLIFVISKSLKYGKCNG